VNFRQTFMNPNLFSNLLQTSKQLWKEFCNKLSPQTFDEVQNNFVQNSVTNFHLKYVTNFKTTLEKFS